MLGFHMPLARGAVSRIVSVNHDGVHAYNALGYTLK